MERAGNDQPDRAVRLSSRSFPDWRGPSYQVRASCGETTAGGRVTVAAAKGKKGKRFRTLGKAKVNSKGVFKLRFRLARGTYRMRYSFKGNSTVARGSVYEVVRISASSASTPRPHRQSRFRCGCR